MSSVSTEACTAGLKWISGSAPQIGGVPSSVAAMWTSNSRSRLRGEGNTQQSMEGQCRLAI